jgi:hypothetical protein
MGEASDLFRESVSMSTAPTRCCYGGGYHVGKLVRNLYRAHETSGTDSAICRGYEGSPKGRKRTRKCTHTFEA